MELGVYIHYPYCRSRCSYCDFAIAVAPEAEIPHGRYLAAIQAELAARAPEFERRTLRSIYIGGGTPSLWPAPAVAAAIASVCERFGQPREVTLEANPVDCQPATLAAWLEAGITRLSIGVQSTHAGELTRLGRDHAMGDGLRAVERALAAGFATVTADVLIAIPGAGTRAAGAASVDALVAAGVPHLSVYELTFEDRTPLGRAAARGEVTPVDEDLRAELYTGVHDRLSAAGFEHYEISSYARPGHRAVHNSLYWRLGEYLGLGNGAASFRRTDAGGERATNARSVGRYLSGAPSQVERFSADELACDRIWLGMRTADGVARAAFAGRERLAETLVRDGLAVADETHIRPTLRGFLLGDLVARAALSS